MNRSRWTIQADISGGNNDGLVLTTINTRSVITTGSLNSGNKFKQGLSWHWNNTSDGNYLTSFTKAETFCNGNFIGYNEDFAKLRYVVVDPSKGTGRRGGENISEVLNQPEKAEYYKLESGYFNLQCQEKINYTFNVRSHLNQWQNALYTSDRMPKYEVKINGWTIAVKRYEYVNLYHTVTDFYNAFLVAKAFNMEQGNITILWIDGHPFGGLDETWKTLFGHVLRAGDITKPCLFSKIVWGIMGYHSPLTRHGIQSVPYIEEFRTFFLTTHGISQTHVLDCNKLKILIIWRRNYLAHPRKPSGEVTRKIKNEDELLESVKTAFLGHEVNGVQLDIFNMSTQLNLIASTDILVGMHGAALSHILFLPKHAGVVELFPSYWSVSNRHFVAFAKWRNIHHLLWKNIDPKRDIRRHSTIVDVKTVTDLILQMKQKIC
ncbi:uncharacterized protein LOC123523389 [Mercenaria mercenaria]|uniref:uncharacterized protein LOC123523389 n=1 Tax=Mercenaria mercenaria TaxID=6596 RepID=UPI00234E573A|nr:uncharacterized protein LOC123523389 [Mercenaria mercenaria]